MVFCATAGLIAPGVVDASGSELCARAKLADTVNRTKIAAAPDHIAACPVIDRAIVPSAPAKRVSLAPARGRTRDNAGCGSRRPSAMPDQSGGSSPSARPRTGGTRHGTGTLVDVDHHQIFPQECFRISAPEVRTPWTGPSSSALRSARRGRRLTTRTAPHMSSTPFRLWLRRRCSSIRRAPRDVLIEQPRFAICARTPKIS